MPAQNPSEHEAKFSVTPESHPKLFAGKVLTFDGYTSQPLGSVSHTDIYLDTPAYDLLRHGMALRVRRGEPTDHAAYEIGIKGIQATRKGAIQTRAEFAMPLPAQADPLDATTWPQAVLEQIRHCGAKARELHPIVQVRQQRQKVHLRPPTSETPLAEWSLDEVWVATMQEGTMQMSANDEGTGHFYELEIERLGTNGTSAPEAETTFAALVSEVQGLFDLQPVYTSKLLRGLEVAIAQSHGNATNLTPTMSLADAGRLLLHQQLFQMMLNEHGVRYTQKAKYIHDMRVAIRRARAVIALCQMAIPAKRVDYFDKGLRRLGRALGHVRDLDVALINLRAFPRQQPGTHHKGIKALRSDLKSRRAHCHAELTAYLDTKKHRKLIAEIAAFCATPLQDNETGEAPPHEFPPRQVRHTLPSLILAAFEAVRAYETAFNDSGLPPLETFHTLRIRAKYLRYLLEFTHHLLGKEGEALISQLRELQEHLGQLNDAYVEQQRLHQWTAKVASDDGLREAIEARLTLLASRIDELAAATPTHLSTFVKITNRQRLAKAIARL